LTKLVIKLEGKITSPTGNLRR